MIATTNKALQFKTARFVGTGRPFEPRPSSSRGRGMGRNHDWPHGAVRRGRASGIAPRWRAHESRLAFRQPLEGNGKSTALAPAAGGAGATSTAQSDMDRVRWTDAGGGSPARGGTMGYRSCRRIRRRRLVVPLPVRRPHVSANLSGFGSKASRRSPTSGSTAATSFTQRACSSLTRSSSSARSTGDNELRTSFSRARRRCSRRKRPARNGAPVWCRIRRCAGTARRCSVACRAGARRSRRWAPGGQS